MLRISLLVLALAAASAYGQGTCTNDGAIYTQSTYYRYWVGNYWGPGVLHVLDDNDMPNNPASHDHFPQVDALQTYRGKCPAMYTNITRSLPHVRPGSYSTHPYGSTSWSTGHWQDDRLWALRWFAWPHEHCTANCNNPNTAQYNGWSETTDSRRLYGVWGNSYKSCKSHFGGSSVPFGFAGLTHPNGLVDVGVQECWFAASATNDWIAACRCSRWGSEIGGGVVGIDGKSGSKFKSVVDNRYVDGQIFAGTPLTTYSVEDDGGNYLGFIQRAFDDLETKCQYGLFRRYSCADNGTITIPMLCAICQINDQTAGCYDQTNTETAGSNSVAGGDAAEARYKAKIQLRGLVRHYWYACEKAHPNDTYGTQWFFVVE